MANLVRSGVTESDIGVGGHSHGQNPVRGGSGILVMVGTNRNKFKPPVKAIKERYYQKFRGKGGEQ